MAQSLYCAVSSATDNPHVPHPTDRRNKAIAPYLRWIRAHPARAGEEAVDKADPSPGASQDHPWSEIRLVGDRDVVVEQMLVVLGADVFGHLLVHAPVTALA